MYAPLTFTHCLAAAVVAVVYLLLRTFRSQKRLLLPPGPRRLPIIGNLLDIPSQNEWLTYLSWTEEYGDIVYAEALGNKILVLGSEETIRDLAEKRVNWQSRGPIPMLNQMDFHWTIGAMPYGERWRQSRKLLHAHVHSGAASAYQPIQMSSARRFVLDLLQNKNDKDVLPLLVRTNFGKTIIKMTYGIDVKHQVDEYVSLPEEVLHALNVATTPGRFLVDIIPILKYVPEWFPGAGFQRYAAHVRSLHHEMRNRPFKVTKAHLAAGTASVSIVQRMLDEMDISNSANEQVIKDLAGSLYLAGSDTTVSAVMSFFLAMIIYPDVQSRAQAELDAVVGRERLPEFYDKKHLPYVNAVMSECLRWLPVAPMGVAHCLMQDDEYKGYFIPKGTLVLPSQWAMLQDPKLYPSPAQFMPERYLERSPAGSWTTRPEVRNPRDFSFGFGRRICPGLHIAEQSLFATVATVLHTLNIGRALDAQGKEIVPHPDVSSGLLSHPKPFDYTIGMRDDATELYTLAER